MVPCGMLFVLGLALAWHGDHCGAVGVAGMIALVAKIFAEKPESKSARGRWGRWKPGTVIPMAKPLIRRVVRSGDLGTVVDGARLVREFGFGSASADEHSVLASVTRGVVAQAQRYLGWPLASGVVRSVFELESDTHTLDLGVGPVEVVGHAEQEPVIKVDGADYQGEYVEGVGGLLLAVDRWGGCRVEVTHGVGYPAGDLPDDLRWALSLAAARAHRGRERAPGLARESLAGVYEAGYRVEALPAESLAVLDAYCEVGL